MYFTITLYVMNWLGRYHIQILWVDEFCTFYRSIQSEVSCCLIFFVVFIYILQLMFLLHKKILLTNVKKILSIHFLNTMVVWFILLIYPWVIYTITFHGYAEFINKKLNAICLVCQGSILVNSHVSKWILSILQFC